jgi:DNA ligase-1
MDSADGSVLGFIDSEFEIVDCLDGRGREAECIIYVCKTPDGKTFNVRPEGTIEDRKQLWYNYCTGEFDPKGKELTVRYQNLSKYNVPRFPVGRAIRDYE